MTTIAWAVDNKSYKSYHPHLKKSAGMLQYISCSIKDVSFDSWIEFLMTETFAEHAHVARRGGNVAKVAREQLEAELGHSVIFRENAQHLLDGKKK